jgi:hypothetical protein
MAKEIYVKQKFGTGATMENVQLENTLPTAVAGGVAYDGDFKVSKGSAWEDVTTATNTQTLTNKTIECEEFN